MSKNQSSCKGETSPVVIMACTGTKDLGGKLFFPEDDGRKLFSQGLEMIYRIEDNTYQQCTQICHIIDTEDV